MSYTQRAKRTSILDQRAAGHGRLEGERTPTWRGEDLHYREDYGTSMDDATYKNIEDQQDKFQTGVTTTQTGIDKDTDAINKAYTTQKTEIDKQQFSAPNFSSLSYNDYVQQQKQQGNWKQVVVFSNGQQIGIHNLPNDAAANYANSVSASGGKSWFSDGMYGVDVVGYGKELHHPVVYAEQDAKKQYDSYVASQKSSYDAQVADARAAFDTSKSSAYSVLNREYDTEKGKLSARQSALQEKIDANKEALNTVRNKYSQKLGSMRETIAAMFEGRGMNE